MIKQTVIALLFVLGITNAIGQSSRSKEKVEAQFWGENDLAPKDRSIPEKWNDESAVILFENLQFHYDKTGSKLKYTSSIRKQVYLKDDVAVDKYSEFSKKDHFFTAEESFWSLIREKEFIGIRIIKPDHSIEVIDIEKSTVKKNKKKYISIPNLETGDIIDFYISTEQKIIVGSAIKAFDPVQTLIQDSYPMKKYRLDFKVNKGYHINFNSYNGAPELEEISSDSKDRHYTLEASDLEKLESERWVYWMKEVPAAKFQVIYSQSPSVLWVSDYYASKEDNTILKTVEMEDIHNKYNRIIIPLKKSKLIENIVESDIRYKRLSSQEEKLNYLFNKLRNIELIDFERLIYSYMTNTLKDITYVYDTSFESMPSGHNYHKMMVKYFLKNNIDFELIAGTERYDGNIKDLLLPSNLDLKYKINLKDKSVFFDYPFFNGSFNNVSPTLQSTEAYSFKSIGNPKSKRSIFAQGELIKMPELNSKDHQLTKHIALELKENFEIIEAEILSKATGYYKTQEHRNNMTLLDVVKDECDYFGTDRFVDKIKTSKKKMTSIKERLQNYEDEQTKKINDKRKEATEESFLIEIEDDFSSELLRLGRFHKDSAFVYSMNFSLKNQLVKKAGPNYIFEIGKFISQQVSIKEDELEREYNIDMTSSREIHNTIDFKIPEGYEIKGLDKLSKSVDNKIGSFTSKTKIEDGHLIINTSKVYKTHHVNKADWLEMVKFLDEAFQFTEEDILLKKSK
ncbi:MAG: DUF3857 domain-containing protein [Flavobacteriales bacterium]